jgi:transposase
MVINRTFLALRRTQRRRSLLPSASRYALGSLAERCLTFHEEVQEQTRHLGRITSRVDSQLTTAFGIGSNPAAELLIAAADDGERIRSEAAFAKGCGSRPVPSRDVIVRMGWHEPALVCVARGVWVLLPRFTEASSKNLRLGLDIFRNINALADSSPGSSRPSRPAAGS